MRFFCIYIREAHPEDGWQLPVNRNQQVVYTQPTTAAERAAVAEACVLRLHLAMPMLLDSMRDEAECVRAPRAGVDPSTPLPADSLYGAWPERLYVIDPAGIITYRSDPGPWGFDVAAWEQAIQLQLPAAQPTA